MTSMHSRAGGSLLALILLVAGCGTPDNPSSATTPGQHSTARGTAASQEIPVPDGWMERAVTFPSDSGTVHGTLLTLRAQHNTPAALLIAGSGPTDRNGDQRGFATGSGRALARMLANHGVASLRYDKLGSGETGLGTTSPAEPVHLRPFTDQAQRALSHLKETPGINPKKLYVVGHSEGALFALLLAKEQPEAIAGVGLIEPLSGRYLDLLSTQIRQQVDTAVAQGSLASADGSALVSRLEQAVSAVRAGGPVPELPPQLAPLFAPVNQAFLREADAFDPADLIGQLAPTTTALLTCSDADIQIDCGQVARVAAARPGQHTKLVTMTGASHVLKIDPSKSAAHYTDDLPWATELPGALAWLVK